MSTFADFCCLLFLWSVTVEKNSFPPILTLAALDPILYIVKYL